jgi:hypothetical protein
VLQPFTFIAESTRSTLSFLGGGTPTATPVTFMALAETVLPSLGPIRTMVKPDVISKQVGPKLSSPLPSRPRWSLVSRCRQWQGGPVFTWASPHCLLRIEYSPALLRKVRSAGAGANASGPLFGVRRGQTIHLVSTHWRSGLEPVGTFTSRIGRVFLTEDDLQQSDKVPVSVMLVISSESAGLFVRNAAGAFGTVGCFREPSVRASTRRVDAPPLPVAVTESKRHRAAGAGACFALALVLVPFIHFWPGTPQHAVAVNVREDKGQLHISWNTGAQKMLTILDRGDRISVAIGPHQSSLTYARHSGDVTVGLGSTQVRFIGPAPPSSDMEQMRAGVETLESKIARLRAVLASRRTKLAALERNSFEPIP